MPCAKCQKEVPAGAAFCPWCAAPLLPGPQEPAARIAPPSGSHQSAGKGWLGCAGLVGILLVVGLLFGVCEQGGGSPASAPPQPNACATIAEGARVCPSSDSWNKNSLETSQECLTLAGPAIALLDPAASCNAEFIKQGTSSIGYVLAFANVGRGPQLVYTSARSIRLTLPAACGISTPPAAAAPAPAQSSSDAEARDWLHRNGFKTEGEKETQAPPQHPPKPRKDDESEQYYHTCMKALKTTAGGLPLNVRSCTCSMAWMQVATTGEPVPPSGWADLSTSCANLGQAKLDSILDAEGPK